MIPGSSIRAGSTRRCADRALALVGIAVLSLLVLVGGSRAESQPTQTGPTGAGSSGTSGAAVECLDPHLRPADACQTVDAEVRVTVDGDDLVVRVANAGDATWRGGPLAVELPVPDAEVDEPEGRDDSAGLPGTPEWTTRVGTVISRCVFDPVDQLRAGSHLTCRVHRFGLPDGEHQFWLTGFVGGLPRVEDEVGDHAPAPGVVAAATTRSVRFRLAGDRVSVLDADPQPGPGGTGAEASESPSNRTALLPLLLALTVVVGAVTAVVLRRRRSA